MCSDFVNSYDGDLKKYLIYNLQRLLNPNESNSRNNIQ
uniref:Uncharacterized protein n=1 Tax=Lepeophtheirus salmonis TaxID=72036 RepID=A0A0K2VIV9_LEPSM